jgi:hypothetical protein
MYAQHGRLGLNDDYGQIVQAARDSDEIEPTDFRRLVSTDIVVSARREGRIHIFPAEVSNTLSKRDVDQAVRTSSLISQVFRNKVGPVTGTEYGDLAVQPMVAGAVVPDLNLARTVGEQGRNIDNLSISLESLRGVVGDLSARVLGNDTEDRAVTKIISDLGVLFRGVRGTRLMYAQHGRLGLNDDYGQIVQAARDSDEIEPTDFRRLVSTDIVVSARREGRIHIFPAEVSNTLSKRDVDQAVRTSSLISQVFRNKVGPVTGTEYGDLAVQPMVAGAVVPDLVQDHADSLDVEVVTVNVPTMRSELERQSEWTS